MYESFINYFKERKMYVTLILAIFMDKLGALNRKKFHRQVSEN